MNFHVADFSSAKALEVFVNDQGILQANITRVIERNGRWYIFYWA